MIEIHLLGPPSVLAGDDLTVSFRTHRVPALLGYLITHQGIHPRQAIAARLWPDAGEDNGKHNLRQTLQYVRHALGGAYESVLDVSRTHVGLIAGSYSSDLDALLAWSMSRSPEQRLRLSTEIGQIRWGQFLPGMPDDWIFETRLRLGQAYVGALIMLADEHMESQPEVALRYAEMAVAEEPLMDGPRARKVRAFVRMGERAAAQFEYEAFAQLLDEELGVLPSDLVRDALDDAAKSGASDQAPEPPPGSLHIEFALEELSRGGRIPEAVELAIALTPYWIEIGAPTYGITQLHRVIALADRSLSDELTFRATLCVAELSMLKGDMSTADALLLELQRSESPSDLCRGQALLIEARIGLVRLEGKLALDRALEALKVLERSPDRRLELEARLQVSNAALYAPDLDEALVQADRSIALAEELGEKLNVGLAILYKARALEAAGQICEAERCVRETARIIDGLTSRKATGCRLHMARLMEALELLGEAELGYQQALRETPIEYYLRIAIVLTYLGDLLDATGRPRQAIDYHRKALQIRQAEAQALGKATSLRGLGRALLHLGQLQEAREALVESANLFRNEEAVPGYASVLVALAWVELKSDHEALAHRLAARGLKLLMGMTAFDRKSNGRSGVALIAEAEQILERVTSSVAAGTDRHRATHP